MKEVIISFFDVFPPEVATFLVAMTPVFELRGSIPLAIGAYQLSPGVAYVISIVGNMVPAVVIMYGLNFIVEFLQKKSAFWHHVFEWVFERSRKRFNHHYDRHGELALLLFVAIPLPMTGVWTASIAAFLLGLKPRTTIWYLFLGALIAGAIVSSITLGLF